MSNGLAVYPGLHNQPVLAGGMIGTDGALVITGVCILQLGRGYPAPLSGGLQGGGQRLAEHLATFQGRYHQNRLTLAEAEFVQRHYKSAIALQRKHDRVVAVTLVSLCLSFGQRYRIIRVPNGLLVFVCDTCQHESQCVIGGWFGNRPGRCGLGGRLLVGNRFRNGSGGVLLKAPEAALVLGREQPHGAGHTGGDGQG